MNEFFEKIRTRENFYLGEPSITTSTLLNNSIFSRKWYLYDVDVYDIFVEDHCDDFDKYINENDDIERCFLFTNYDKVDCMIVNYFVEFLEGMLSENNHQITIDPSKDVYFQEGDVRLLKIKQFKNHVDKMNQYAHENNLIDEEAVSDYTGKYVIINEKNVEILLEKEWKCFLSYEYFDGNHNVYWLMNMNKDSPFFEYVVVLGSHDIIEFYHFSEMDNNMKTVEKVCNDFDLFK